MLIVNTLTTNQVELYDFPAEINPVFCDFEANSSNCDFHQDDADEEEWQRIPARLYAADGGYDHTTLTGELSIDRSLFTDNKISRSIEVMEFDTSLWDCVKTFVPLVKGLERLDFVLYVDQSSIAFHGEPTLQ